jgi:hypothetical protein
MGFHLEIVEQLRERCQVLSKRAPAERTSPCRTPDHVIRWTLDHVIQSWDELARHKALALLGKSCRRRLALGSGSQTAFP